jgi:hypothetical protein
MSFDPHAFGKSAAVDIAGAAFAVASAVRQNAIARADARATGETLAEWEAVLAERENRIDNLEVALDLADQSLIAQAAHIAALEAQCQSLALQLQDALLQRAAA